MKSVASGRMARLRPSKICEGAEPPQYNRDADRNHQYRVHFEQKHKIKGREQRTEAASERGDEIEIPCIVAGGFLVLHDDSYRIGRDHAREDRRQEKQPNAGGERAIAGVDDVVEDLIE